MALVLLLAGCATPEPEAPAPARRETVPAPADAGGFAECASTSAQQLGVNFRAAATQDARGLGAGLHRLNATSFLWVWATYDDTLREDRVTRVNEVQVFREPDGRFLACTRVDLAAPTDVDAEARSYVVAVRFDAPQGVPEGPLRFVVNWVAGCPCEPLPRGNATAVFP